MKLTGYVQNESDGSVCYLQIAQIRPNAHSTDRKYQVTGEAQGEKASLSQLMQHLNKGPSAARVSNVEQSDIATKDGEKGFSQ